MNSFKTANLKPNLKPIGQPQFRDGEQEKLVDRLRGKIRSIETVGRIQDESCVSSGCTAINQLLPGSGYERGALVQWLTGGGQGADYLSLLVAREACRDGGALVVFDPRNRFYPPAAAAIGINLDHLIVLRNPQSTDKAISNDLLWSIDQSLRCPAVAAVWGSIDHIEERWFRRFQLSAESSGCLGLFVQPTREARQPTWADVQWLVDGELSFHRRDQSPQSSKSENEYDSCQQVRLQLIRCRGTQTGQSVNLAIDTISGDVRKVQNLVRRRSQARNFREKSSAGTISHG